MKKRGLSRFLLVALVAVTAVVLYKIVSDDWEPGVVVSLSGLEVDDLESTAFRVVDEPTMVEISATGSRQIDTLLAAYPWIIRSSDRSLVWRLRADASDGSEGGMLVSTSQIVELDPDTYEVYFASYGHPQEPVAEPEGFIDKIIASFNDEFEKWRTESNKWQVIIKAPTPESKNRLKAADRVREITENPLEIWNSGSSDSKSVAEFTFETERSMNVLVECMGTVSDESSIGWIEHVGTGDHLWDMTESGSMHAGGDERNRVCREEVALDEGIFRAVYKSDRKHSHKHWSGNPPYDPLSWGLRISALSPEDYDAVAPFDPFESLPKIVSLTGIGEDALVSYTFRVEEAMRVLIHAVGEGYTSSDRMFDYAWLVDEKRRKEVWKMSARDSKHAGGASKNRRAEVVLELGPGAYTVHYKSDGSHSYGDWNDDPPLSPQRWGVTVFSLDPNFVPSVDPVVPVPEVAPINSAGEAEEILVNLTGLGDYEEVSDRFVLEDDAKLHIFALGEMTLDGRYDYGWITDAGSGRVVWEMNRKESVKAGGSSKNRRVDTVIGLPAGEYEVHFRTDDSHSYPTFKYGGAPNSPESWGIAVWLIRVPEVTPPTPPSPPTPPQ